MNFKLFADELRNRLLLLGLRETDARPFEIDFYYKNICLITIHYDYEYITSSVFDKIDYFQGDVFKEYYDDMTHVDSIINVVSKYIKERKQAAIKDKLKELENDFEPSRWSKFVNCVHKLLRNLWSLLNKQDTWYLIALFPLFGALIYTGYYIFNMCFAFFSSL